LSIPSNFEIGNAGFAAGRTNEAQWELAERLDYVRGKHFLKFGAEMSRTHTTDSAFGGFDPDAQRQNGTFGGTYGFSSFPNFALGRYDTFAQSAGSPTFSFAVPYVAFYAQDTYQLRPRLTFDCGVREDFQVFPNTISDPSLFGAPNISIVDPHFRTPYVLQGSLQIETEILPETLVSIGAMWTHGVHLISSSAYDLNLMPPTGTTTYVVCPAGTLDAPCAGHQVVLPNLDSNLLQEGRINPNFGQINELVSPGVNNYNSLFVQVQRRFRRGLAFQFGYTLSKNLMSNGVDFSNQFDFSGTHAPDLLDQRHRISFAGVYTPFGRHFDSALLGGLLSHWTISAAMQFASGRPYAALLDSACTSSTNSLANCDNLPGTGNATLNDTAANQSTANSALGINGAGPSPAVGLNSFYGPWSQQVDLGIARRFVLGEGQAITFQVQAFNLLNHANYYVQNGNGVNPIQYEPVGATCGDGASPNQTCYLVPNAGPGGFRTLQIVNALNGPRVLQFAFKYTF
jgi:hypothetical protein